MENQAIHEHYQSISVENFTFENWQELDKEDLQDLVLKCVNQLPATAKNDPIFMAILFKNYNLEKETKKYLFQATNEYKKILDDYQNKSKDYINEPDFQSCPTKISDR